MEIGNGKGLVIGFTAVILALWGFEVTCISSFGSQFQSS